MTSKKQPKPAEPFVAVRANRKARKWSRRENFGRVLWALCLPFFALSPRPFWGWRALILRLFGAKVGRNVRIAPSVRITIPWNLVLGDEVGIGEGVQLYALGKITVGARATISQGAHLCAGSHDYLDPALRLLKLPIVIKEEAWICADAFVGPGVTVGKKTVLGARAVLMKDASENLVLIGNPASIIKKRVIDL